jgi:hypothetical protein
LNLLVGLGASFPNFSEITNLYIQAKSGEIANTAPARASQLLEITKKERKEISNMPSIVHIDLDNLFRLPKGSPKWGRQSKAK